MADSKPITLTQERLKELLDYDPETGFFLWRCRICKSVSIGQKAGTVNSEGYVNIKISGRVFKAHRLAWVYVTGNWPTCQIDHINGVRTDNRIENLREADELQNHRNYKIRVDNTSGFRGVSKRSDVNKWYARIKLLGNTICLGTFATPKEAAIAYDKAAILHHGEFAKLNFPENRYNER